MPWFVVEGGTTVLVILEDSECDDLDRITVRVHVCTRNVINQVKFAEQIRRILIKPLSIFPGNSNPRDEAGGLNTDAFELYFFAFPTSPLGSATITSYQQ